MTCPKTCHLLERQDDFCVLGAKPDTMLTCLCANNRNALSVRHNWRGIGSALWIKTKCGRNQTSHIFKFDREKWNHQSTAQSLQKQLVTLVVCHVGISEGQNSLSEILVVAALTRDLLTDRRTQALNCSLISSKWVATRNGRNASWETLCCLLLPEIRRNNALHGSTSRKGHVKQRQIYCDSPTMSFMLNLATAEQTCSLSVTVFHLLLLSSERVTPLLQNPCKHMEDSPLRMQKGRACTMEWPMIRAQSVSRYARDSKSKVLTVQHQQNGMDIGYLRRSKHIHPRHGAPVARDATFDHFWDGKHACLPWLHMHQECSGHFKRSSRDLQALRTFGQPNCDYIACCWGSMSCCNLNVALASDHIGESLALWIISVMCSNLSLSWQRRKPNSLPHQPISSQASRPQSLRGFNWSTSYTASSILPTG